MRTYEIFEISNIYLIFFFYLIFLFNLFKIKYSSDNYNYMALRINQNQACRPSRTQLFVREV